MKIRTQLLVTSLSILGVMLVTGSFSIIQLKKLYEDSMGIMLQKVPLQNAVTEIKLNTTTAHLWFEEIMVGKEEKTAIKTVWQLLDNSLWYADAMIKGGTRKLDIFYPINDEAIAGQIQFVKQDIEKLINSAHLRFNNPIVAQESQEQALDDQFDWIFDRFIDNANQVQTLLKTKIANDLKHLDEYVNTLKYILIIIHLLGIGIVTWISYSLIREIRYQVGGEPAEIASIAEQIAAGHFNLYFKTGSSTTGIYAAVQKMVKNLQQITSEQEQQNWLRRGQTQLSERMRGEQTILQLAENILQFITPYLDASVGAFYLLQLTEKKDYLKMIASYAYTWRNNSNYEFQIGEGIVGQVALERKLFVTHKVPANYMLIQSGLGESNPHALLVAPILYENTLIGVIEFASFSAFTEAHLELLKLTRPAIAIAINMAQSRTQTQELLEQSQLQAEELRSQQEELQQTNEELQVQAAQLQDQQEKLRQVNEQLEERSQELEREQRAIQEKNVELEQVNLVIEAKVEELELTSQYKSEFLANISHELRTPLNSLLILSQVLTSNKEGNLTAEQLKYAQTIYNASADLLNLINDILDLSKVEAGKMEINLEPVALTQLITVLEDRFRLVAQEKGLKLVIQLANDLPPSLYTDEQRLIQILTNLLGNAFKFTAKGQITLAIHRPAQSTHLAKENLDTFNCIAIDIIDTGIGIPTEKQQLIFEAFQQVDGTTSRQYGGTGLGLSISRQLVHLLGGEIHLQSKEGEGSIFTVYLPEQLPTKPTSIEPEPPPVITSSPSPITLPVVLAKPPETVEDDRDNLQESDKFLLIIEDDLTFAHLLMKTAHEKAFKCLVATEGQSGLQLARKYQPHAIILDIRLPEIDGWSIMEQLKADSHTRPIPVHFISGTDSQQIAKQRGAIGYCLKPVSREGLYDVFNNIDHFITKTVKELLILSDELNHQQALMKIVKSSDIHVTLAMIGREVYPMLQGCEFDCVVLDISVEPDKGIHLLEELYPELHLRQMPVIIYAERDLTTLEESILKTYLDELIVREAHSPEKLLDEVTLFLHQIESHLSQSQQQLLHQIHEQQNCLVGKQVLLVDDDMRNVFALAAALEKEGIEILVAHDGHHAIQQLQAKPDIAMVLMDIMMPKIDGHDAIRQIRAQPQFRQLPIIALTAKAMKADRTKCLEAGANDYLAKPINIHNLLSLLRVWLH